MYDQLAAGIASVHTWSLVAPATAMPILAGKLFIASYNLLATTLAWDKAYASGQVG